MTYSSSEDFLLLSQTAIDNEDILINIDVSMVSVDYAHLNKLEIKKSTFDKSRFLNCHFETVILKMLHSEKFTLKTVIFQIVNLLMPILRNVFLRTVNIWE